MVSNEWSSPEYVFPYAMTITAGDITVLLSFLFIIFVRGLGVFEGIEWH